MANHPLLIYLPGMEGTGQLFYRQQPLLSAIYKVVAVPSRSDPPFDYNALVKDVLHAIDQNEAEKAIIVAESFGGTVALQFGLQHQDRVEKLVLINTFPYFRRRLRLLLGLILLPLTFIPIGNSIREFIYKKALGYEGLEKEDVEKLCACSFSHGYAASRNRMRLIKEIDVRNRLSEIHVPVTIIASCRDKIVPSVQEAQYMAKHLQNARVVELPAHGHTPLLTPTFSLLDAMDDRR